MYDPVGPNKVVPSLLTALAEHPERTRWLAAILLRRTTRRWRDWSCEFALATVDSALQVYQCDFLVRPPVGWEEDERRELPPGLSAERLLNEGLSPGQAMTILNDIFGQMSVHTNGGMASHSQLDDFQIGAAVRASWSYAGIWNGIADHLRILLTENCHVDFVAPKPLACDLSESARSWADGYVIAEIAHRLMTRALDDFRETELANY